MRLDFLPLGILVGMLAGPAAAVPDGTLDNGHYRVNVNRFGLLTSVPKDGITPGYGPRVAVAPGFHEWFGVSFDGPNGRVSAVGLGDAPDYGNRMQVQFVSFTATSERATAVSRIGDLEIQTDLAFDPFTNALVVCANFTNRGTTTIANVVYSREWQIPGTAGATFPPEFAWGLPHPPPDVRRLAWMPNNLAPGCGQGVTLDLAPDGEVKGSGVDVPLQQWKGGRWPNGLTFGDTNGISFGDYDHDGWIDVFATKSGRLWRNLDGVNWQRVATLTNFYEASSVQYGAALADYDNDQLLDIGTEPRGNCMHLLHNLGNATFDDVAIDPTIVDVQPCNAASETMCVADTDGDGNLDWFLPTYPPWIGSTGNWYLHNLGPVGAGGACTFHEASAEAGLDNPDDVNRPEGAEFVDVDLDGDVDLYSNGTLYRNLSVPGTPLFEAMTEKGTGIIHSDVLDEGAGFFDYDNDGDMDLCVAFCDGNLGVRMFESRGDGTYFLTKSGIFDSYNTGLCLGLSHEDWDNDGDVDVTTSEVFRRNMFVEEGVRHFTVATHSIDPNHITDATPAWGDFDKDGDIDSALGNWFEKGRLYENYTYNPATPLDQRRYVRVRVMRDSDVFDDGLESEFGAQVAVQVLGAADDGLARVKVVSASGGYLNQNEYVLHFALPADPDPTDPEVDLHFAVSVDLKGASAAGFLRIDRHVNPALGDIDLAQLDQREIVVFRSGRVQLDGCDFHPTTPAAPLSTTTGGLLTAGIDTPIPLPVAAPGTDWFVGLEVSTTGATAPQRIEELILDGQLDVAVDCGGTLANVFVWDVTDPALPALVSSGAVERATHSLNNRSALPLDVTFAPDRTYHVVARVTFLRATPVFGPVDDGEFTTIGGLSFQDLAPCTGAGAAAAAVDLNNVYAALRFRPAAGAAWADMGEALAGVNGDPSLTGTGDLRSGTPFTLDLANAAPSAPLLVVFGFDVECVPFAGGVIVPALDLILGGVTTDANGGSSFAGTWPTDLPGGSSFYSQAFIADPAAVQGFAMSNAIVGTTPY